MNFFKFVLKFITLLTTILVGVFAYHYLTDTKIRNELKMECSGENCPCFENIVDYRLTKDQAKTFLRYLQSRRLRPDTKILEFTTFYEAKEIFDMFAICQMKPVPTIQQNDHANEAQSSEHSAEEEGEIQ